MSPITDGEDRLEANAFAWATVRNMLSNPSALPFNLDTMPLSYHGMGTAHVTCIERKQAHPAQPYLLCIKFLLIYFIVSHCIVIALCIGSKVQPMDPPETPGKGFFFEDAEISQSAVTSPDQTATNIQITDK